MADIWTFVVLLTWYMYIGVCDGAICSRRYRNSYGLFGYTSTTYMYCSYGCCGSSYNRYCCTSSGTIAGIVIAVLAGICIVAFLFCLCVKKQKRPGRVVMPHSNISRNNLTVVYAGTSGPGPSAYRGGPPVPPPYKAHDPPPSYTYGPGPNNGGRQINTSALHPGSHHSPLAPQAWSGAPPRNENPPMPQPQPPPRTISSPPPPYSALSNGPANGGNNIHPAPGPIPPATAPVDHTQ